ncbi:MAG: DUF3276 family protein [Bacteroidota bacterium]
MATHQDNEEVYSQRVKAGKRTYFFDVKPTGASDYYLIITESKKQPKDNGQGYKKNKIFLYKEDLNKFIAALQDTAEHIKKELLPHYNFDKFSKYRDDEATSATDQ